MNSDLGNNLSDFGFFESVYGVSGRDVVKKNCHLSIERPFAVTSNCGVNVSVAVGDRFDDPAQLRVFNVKIDRGGRNRTVSELLFEHLEGHAV